MYVKVSRNEYWVEQTGSGPPLLLLHGFTGSSKTWKPFIPTFLKNFHVITMDLPGHGRTIMQDTFSMKSVCSDIQSLMEYFDYEKVNLLGYSMGGRTALSYANYFPNGVESLILESTSPGLASEDDRNTRIANDTKLSDFIKNNGVIEFIDYWENIPLFQTQKNLSTQVKQAIREERLSHKDEGLSASLRFMGTGSQPSWWDSLDRLEIPVYLIAGELDIKFVNINKKMVELLPNASLKVVSGVGHAVHVEDPQKFDKIVLDFLKREDV